MGCWGGEPGQAGEAEPGCAQRPRKQAAYHGASSQGRTSFTVSPIGPQLGRPGAIQAGNAGHTPGSWESNRPKWGQTDAWVQEARGGGRGQDGARTEGAAVLGRVAVVAVCS